MRLRGPNPPLRPIAKRSARIFITGRRSYEYTSSFHSNPFLRSSIRTRFSFLPAFSILVSVPHRICIQYKTTHLLIIERSRALRPLTCQKPQGNEPQPSRSRSCFR
ncbi:hypothetical protein FA13DRAFT_1480583 [Coprinellus micaceus]|uniref:Uncharacterized protein n=1 Tax=Coprinellus micaceus TaxID=71717 RepID=A0A4Y7SMU8_COPMI|nr:hypothetical protein FA13DRAFT_1480583 [Coprinellus micaceus]